MDLAEAPEEETLAAIPVAVLEEIPVEDPVVLEETLAEDPVVDQT